MSSKKILPYNIPAYKEINKVRTELLIFIDKMIKPSDKTSQQFICRFIQSDSSERKKEDKNFFFQIGNLKSNEVHSSIGLNDNNILKIQEQQKNNSQITKIETKKTFNYKLIPRTRKETMELLSKRKKEIIQKSLKYLKKVAIDAQASLHFQRRISKKISNCEVFRIDPENLMFKRSISNNQLYFNEIVKVVTL